MSDFSSSVLLERIAKSILIQEMKCSLLLVLDRIIFFVFYLYGSPWCILVVGTSTWAKNNKSDQR